MIKIKKMPHGNESCGRVMPLICSCRFRKTISRADALFFVTDKAQCINTVAERKLLCDTLDDLQRVQHIKPIPLIILINKVDFADEALDEAIHACRAFVAKEMDKRKCSFTVAYCKVSMMNIFFLRYPPTDFFIFFTHFSL